MIAPSEALRLTRECKVCSVKHTVCAEDDNKKKEIQKIERKNLEILQETKLFPHRFLHFTFTLKMSLFLRTDVDFCHHCEDIWDIKKSEYNGWQAVTVTECDIPLSFIQGFKTLKQLCWMSVCVYLKKITLIDVDFTTGFTHIPTFADWCEKLTFFHLLLFEGLQC